MNLIQLQDRLRSMPMKALQQYANGMNPEVPPWLALSVLQQKQMDAQRQQVAQGAAMGEMPTVKDKVEQSAGLMALQGQKQQQAAQQSAMQNMRKPGPVPGGVPPAEPQPQAPQMGMRAGGIVRLPSGLRMAGGGIVGYDVGGRTSPAGRWLGDLQKDTEKSRRLEALRQRVRQEYGLSAGPFGVFKPQTDLERAKAKDIIARVDKMDENQLEQLLARRAPIDAPRTAPTEQAPPGFEVKSDVDGRDEQPAGIQNLLARRARSATRMRDVQGKPQGAYQTTPEDLKGSVPGFGAAPAGADQEVAAPAVSAAPNIPDVQMPQAAAPEMPSQPSMPRYDTPEAAFAAQQKLNEMAGYKAPEYSETRALDEEIRARKQGERKRRALEDMFTTLGGARSGYGGIAAAYDAISRRQAEEQKAEDTRRAGLASMYDTGKQDFAKSNVVGASNIFGKGVAETGETARKLMGEKAATSRQISSDATRQAIAVLGAKSDLARTVMQNQNQMSIAQLRIAADKARSDLDRAFDLTKMQNATALTKLQLAETARANKATETANDRRERELAFKAGQELVRSLSEQLKDPMVNSAPALKDSIRISLAEAQDALRQMSARNSGFEKSLPQSAPVVPGPGAK